MKHQKNPILYLLILALCVSLFAGLSGCGDKNEPGTDEPGKTPSGEQPTPDVTPEFIYTAEYVPVEGEHRNSFNNLLYSNDKLLISSYEMLNDNTPEGVVPEWEGQYWEWGEVLYWLGLDGKLEKVENYVPLAAPKEEGIDSNSYMQNMMLDADGNIVMLVCVNRSWYDGPDDLEMWSDEWWNAGYYDDYYHQEQHYYLRTLAPDGSELRCLPLEGLQEAAANASDNGDEVYGGGNYFYLNNMAIGPEGNIYFCSEQVILIVDAEGKLCGTVSTDSWVDTMIALPDGVYIGIYGESGEMLAPIDAETLTIGEGVPARNLYGASVSPAGSAYDFCYTDGSNLMGYSLAKADAEKVLNWINCDVDPGNLSSPVMLPDGRILAIASEWDKDYTYCDMNLVFLKQVPYDSVPHKQVITLATQYTNNNTQGTIVKFNRNNPDYRIELKDYSEYNTEEDYSAGLTKLTTEILAGNVPDIIDLNGMPTDRFAGKGLLADLYPLLDADETLSRDDLFPSVLSAAESNGHLYQTVSGFYIQSVVGAASIVGDTPGWTLADFKAALAKMPEGCTPFEESYTRGQVMQQMLSMELDSLIDWNTGECHFDSPAFRDILEFAAQFPESFEYPEDYVWTEEDNAPNRIATGRQMLVNMQLYSFEEYQMYDAMFGGDATFIGFPVSEGVGNALLVSDSSSYAISAKCAVPEVAWQFVRTFFTEDYQTKNVYEFPTNRAAFDKKLKEAMTPEYQKDAEGNFVLDENGEKIEISQGGWGWGSLQVDIRALTQAEADEILDVINGTTRITSWSASESNTEITDIIMQDTEAYFLGQKSLDDVVRLLQSKLNILINEQR